MKKIIGCFLLFLIQFIFSSVYAVKAYNGVISVTQPDGNKLLIALHGDEHNHYLTTDDGYMIQQSADGYYKYATFNTKGEVVESQLNVSNKKNRGSKELQFLKTISLVRQSVQLTTQATNLPANAGLMRSKNAVPIQKSFPRTGSSKSLVILVNFSDNIFSVASPQAAYTNLLNQSGYSVNGGTGSAKDYFMSSSYGKFSPVFDVVGPYTLPNNLAFYGTNVSNSDQNPRQMVIDACTLAANAGVNFAQYDTDSNGSVDNVFIYYAGYNEAEGAPSTTIWPHRWALANKTNIFNGKYIYDYACTSELRSNAGANMCGIGTFCHEFGHVLGLPDYYHTNDATNTKATLGSWSIMDYGSYSNVGRTPPTYSSYDRFYLGWLTPEEIKIASNQTLLPLYQGTTQPATTYQQSYLISATSHNLSGSAPNPTEFFMLEYRKKTGWDSYLPSEGLLIWHIDYNLSAWNSNTPNNYTGAAQTPTDHMRVYLQPLSGSTTTPGTSFSSGAFTPTSWAGINIDRAITDIVKTTDNLSFKLKYGADINVSELTTPSTVDVVVPAGSKFISNVAGQTIHSITLEPGGNLDLTNALNVTADVVLKADNSLSFNANVGNGASVTGALKFQKTIDDAHWYFLSFPCNVLISGITKADGGSLGTLGVDWFIQTYNGLSRVSNLGSTSNWENIVNTTLSLEAYKGYAIGIKTGVGPYEVLFPLQKTLLSSEPTRSVPVVAYGSASAVSENHKGWNLVGQPYLSKYNSSSAGVNFKILPADAAAQTYQTINSSTAYTLPPFSAFFVQADVALQTSQISFVTTGRQLVPMMAQNLTDDIQLNLSTPTGNDNTNLLLDDTQTTAYVIGQDMEKWIGVDTDKPQIYSIINGINYAYNALPTAGVANLALGYYSKAGGSSVISCTASQNANIAQLILTDKQNGATTDLLSSTYTFNAAAGTTNSRFVLQAKRVATANDALLPTTAPILKSISGKLTIENLEGKNTVCIYNSIGQLVTCRKLVTDNFEIQLMPNQVYNIRVNSELQTWSYKFLNR